MKHERINVLGFFLMESVKTRTDTEFRTSLFHVQLSWIFQLSKLISSFEKQIQSGWYSEVSRKNWSERT